MGQQEDEVIRWVYDTLYNQGDQPHFRAFAGSRRLYSTGLDTHGLLLSLVDGVGRPAPFKYQGLLDVVREVTGGSVAHRVTVLMHDNMVAEVVSARRVQAPWRRSALELFEAEEGAAQGGVSFLGLIPEGRDWLLWHCYDPCNDFSITFFGPVSLCEELDRSLELGHRRLIESPPKSGTPLL